MTTPSDPRNERCRSCNGTGSEADYVGLEMRPRPVEVECSNCGGSGYAASRLPVDPEPLPEDPCDFCEMVQRHMERVHGATPKEGGSQHDGSQHFYAENFGGFKGWKPAPSPKQTEPRVFRRRKPMLKIIKATEPHDGG